MGIYPDGNPNRLNHNPEPITYGTPISTSNLIPKPGQTFEFQTQRPDCEHNFTFRAPMMNGAIEEKYALEIRERLRNTPCEQCIKEKREKKHAEHTNA